jgi:hypothetical protein
LRPDERLNNFNEVNQQVDPNVAKEEMERVFTAADVLSAIIV